MNVSERLDRYLRSDRLYRKVRSFRFREFIAYSGLCRWKRPLAILLVLSAMPIGPVVAGDTYFFNSSRKIRPLVIGEPVVVGSTSHTTSTYLSNRYNRRIRQRYDDRINRELSEIADILHKYGRPNNRGIRYNPYVK